MKSLIKEYLITSIRDQFVYQPQVYKRVGTLAATRYELFVLHKTLSFIS
jgi:hypothetical protein